MIPILGGIAVILLVGGCIWLIVHALTKAEKPDDHSDLTNVVIPVLMDDSIKWIMSYDPVHRQWVYSNGRGKVMVRICGDSVRPHDLAIVCKHFVENVKR